MVSKYILCCTTKKFIPIQEQRNMIQEKPKRKYKKDETPSVLRKKIKKVESSRDVWKDKNREHQKSLKALKQQFEGIKVNRDCVRLDCLRNANDLHIYKEKVKDLEQELMKERFEKVHLYQQIDEFKKKLKN